jgi:predicted  nucleic acid-binding Zn-ribbon protein
MGVSKESLFELGACEEAVVELEQREARLPGQIAEAEAKAQAARDAVAAARDQLAEFEKTQRAREGELQEAESQRTKFQGQTALVKTNEEYTALLREIDLVNGRVSQLEEGILLGMEAIDTGRGRVESVGKEQELLERGHLADAEGLRRQLEEVGKDLAERIAERAGRLAELGTAVQSLYQRVARALGSGVATVREDRCSGCHRAIPPQTVNLMLSGEVRTCSNCQRILVPGEL